MLSVILRYSMMIPFMLSVTVIEVPTLEVLRFKYPDSSQDKSEDQNSKFTKQKYAYLITLDY